MALRDSLKTFVWSRYLLWVLGALVLIVFGAIAYWLGWLGSPWFWVILLLLAALGIFVALRWEVIPKVQEWLFLRREGSPRYVAAGGESPREFLEKFKNALQTLRSLPQELPWYVLMGEKESGKTAALQGTNPRSFLHPLPNRGGATQNCDWWVSNTTVVLDTTGRYALQTDGTRDRTEWYRLLRLLRHYRRQRPIHGLVITVGADVLISRSEEKLRADGSQLRLRLKEAVEELGTDFPVYLLVTKCDLIEGFSQFFAQLPERMRNEALGYVYDPPLQPKNEQQAAPAPNGFKAGLQSIYDRLHLFRFALLNDSRVPEDLRQAIFCFPEEFKGLYTPLTTFAERLFQYDVLYNTPLFRGIFFTSATQQGPPLSLVRRQLRVEEVTTPLSVGDGTHSFLHDFFDKMLPRDRFLARTTERAHRRGELKWILGIVAGAGLVLLLAAPLSKAYRIDQRIISAVEEEMQKQRCPAGEPKVSPVPLLDEVDRCRQVVQNLIALNEQRPRWTRLVFARSLQREKELRQLYVKKFQAEVLAPLNTTLSNSFQRSTDSLPLLLFVAERIKLGGDCVKNFPDGCSPVVADALQSDDYRLMLDPERNRQARPQDVARLKATYTAYLSWQRAPKEALRHDLEEDQELLGQKIADGRFSLTPLLAWVNRKSRPVTYETYWKPPVPPISAGSPPQIEPACLRKTREEDIDRFLTQIAEAIPNRATELHDFQERLSTTCFQQWQFFLTRFSEGAAWWRGPERQGELVLWLLREDSPYRQVIEQAFANLELWIPAEGVSGSVPSSARSLQHYATSEQQKQDYQGFLKKIAGRLDSNSLPQTCFELAQEGFIDSKPEESNNPVLQAWRFTAQIGQAGGGTQNPDEDLVGRLLREQVRIVWRIILDQAGLYLQKTWTDNVLVSLNRLPLTERAIRLYDPGGEVGAFIKNVRLFLKDGEVADSPIGGRIPFSPGFRQLLSNAKQLKPVFDEGPHPVRVTAVGGPYIEGPFAFQAPQTVLVMTCGGTPYQVSNTLEGATKSIPWTYQGCGEVSITIFFSDQGQRFSLTKRYTGSIGFLQFLQDFDDGRQRFPMTDFPEADPEVLKKGIRGIEVYFRIDIPLALKKLLSVLKETTLPIEIISHPAS